jgi:sigma-54 dependent transcriptional regulator, acetoin dehydrogenase operon transcriptional activator AcoR
VLVCALDHSEIVPVGGSKPVRVDVQVIAATNSRLLNCVRNGTFRRDLYYRLNGAQLWLPPLRERPDKLDLIQNLWAEEMKAQGVLEPKVLSAEVWEIFERHPWPGNIRESRNVLRSCLAMTRGSVTRVADLPNDFLEEMTYSLESPASEVERPEPAGALSSPEAKPLADWEADAIRSALAMTAGNISQSARKLGITRATLYHKMERHGLRRERHGRESSVR